MGTLFSNFRLGKILSRRQIVLQIRGMRKNIPVFLMLGGFFFAVGHAQFRAATACAST